MRRLGPRGLAAICLSIGSVIAGCSASSGAGSVGSAPGTGLGSTPPSAVACPTTQPAPLPAGETRTVRIDTSKGPITIKVDAALAPIAAGNFVALASCGFYDKTVFHRLVPGFVIQGGDPDGNGSGGPGYTIKDETVTTPYRRGTVAMARSSQPNSEGSQFFIVLSDGAGPILSSYNTYAIFGSVTDGMAAVDAIAAMPNSGEPNNAALQPVAMTTVRVSTP